MPRRWHGELGLGVLAGFLSGVLSTVVVVVAGAFFFNEWIAERVALSTHSCDAPGDLRLLRPEELHLQGEWFGQRAKDDEHHYERIVDGRPGSLWIPPIGPPSVGAATFVPASASAGTLTVGLIDRRGEPVNPNLQLVCVVNGLASEPVRYRNWGRIRTVLTETQDSDEVNRSVLQSLPDDSIQQPQEVRVERGETGWFSLRILDAYSGQTVLTYDGDLCGQETPSGGGWELAYERGCLVGATRKAGLAELYVYVKADS